MLPQVEHSDELGDAVCVCRLARARCVVRLSWETIRLPLLLLAVTLTTSVMTKIMLIGSSVFLVIFLS